MIERKTKHTSPKITHSQKKKPGFRTSFSRIQQNEKRMTINQLKKTTRPLFEKKEILKALLFGSFARVRRTIRVISISLL